MERTCFQNFQFVQKILLDRSHRTPLYCMFSKNHCLFSNIMAQKPIFNTQQICNETFRLEVASLPPIWKISTNPPKSVGQVVPKLVILVHITGRTLLTPSQITCARKSPGKSTKKAKEGAQKEKYTRWRPQQAWISGHRCVLKKVRKTSNLSKGSHIEIISGGVVVFVFVLQTGRQAIYLAF